MHLRMDHMHTYVCWTIRYSLCVLNVVPKPILDIHLSRKGRNAIPHEIVIRDLKNFPSVLLCHRCKI